MNSVEITNNLSSSANISRASQGSSSLVQSAGSIGSGDSQHLPLTPGDVLIFTTSKGYYVASPQDGEAIILDDSKFKPGQACMPNAASGCAPGSYCVNNICVPVTTSRAAGALSNLINNPSCILQVINSNPSLSSTISTFLQNPAFASLIPAGTSPSSLLTNPSQFGAFISQLSTSSVPAIKSAVSSLAQNPTVQGALAQFMNCAGQAGQAVPAGTSRQPVVVSTGPSAGSIILWIIVIAVIIFLIWYFTRDSRGGSIF